MNLNYFTPNVNNNTYTIITDWCSDNWPEGDYLKSKFGLTDSNLVINDFVDKNGRLYVYFYNLDYTKALTITKWLTKGFYEYTPNLDSIPSMVSNSGRLVLVYHNSELLAVPYDYE